MEGARNQVTTLSQQLDIYRLNNGSYPEDLMDLVEQPADMIGWAGPYVKRSLLNDPWGNDWVYVVPGQHGDFDLYSLGADGQEGGEGNDADLRIAAICCATDRTLVSGNQRHFERIKELRYENWLR